MANARKKKNYIHTLQTDSGLAVTQSENMQSSLIISHNISALVPPEAAQSITPS
jgi:hypothetical protein